MRRLGILVFVGRGVSVLFLYVILAEVRQWRIDHAAFYSLFYGIVFIMWYVRWINTLRKYSLIYARVGIWRSLHVGNFIPEGRGQRGRQLENHHLVNLPLTCEYTSRPSKNIFRFL